LEPGGPAAFHGRRPGRAAFGCSSPGTATEADLLAVLDHEHRLCELIDGVLVEKDMATFESSLAAFLIHLIHTYLASHPGGMVTAPDGPLRLALNRVRMPDVSVILWERFPTKKMPASQAIFEVVPDLAVEILSKGNTRREMSLKRDEYLEAGVQLVWYISPRARTATVSMTEPQEYDSTARSAAARCRVSNCRCRSSSTLSIEPA
jgi:Uma2 family endonuclease